MASREPKSKWSKKYGRKALPAAILSIAVVLFTLLGIGIGLYNRRNKPQEFYELIPGIDLTPMDTGRRTELLQGLNRQACTCGCDMTLARCRNVDSACPVSLRLARELTMQTGEPGL